MNQKRRKINIEEVIVKAWSDPDYKRKLIDDPIPNIEAIIGETLNLSDNRKIVVSDQSDTSKIFLNLQKPQDEQELSEEQLESVAGGLTVKWKETRDANGFCTGYTFTIEISFFN